MIRHPHRNRLWEPVSLVPSTWYRWGLEGAEVCLWNRGDQWRWAASARTPAEIRGSCFGPEPMAGNGPSEYSVCFAPTQPVALRPYTLNRPFVVSLSSPIVVHRDHEACISVDLPVSVRLELASGVILATPNTILLTKTWFGDTTSGIPCFLWPEAIGEPREETFSSMVRCSILVQNHSRGPLVLKQFAVYSELLSLWSQGADLVTNEVLLEGLPDGSLRMVPLPRTDSDSLDLVFQAPVGQAELMIKRGVDFLRSITGIS